MRSGYLSRIEALEHVCGLLQLVQQVQTARGVAEVVLQPQVREGEVLGVAHDAAREVVVALQPLNLHK